MSNDFADKWISEFQIQLKQWQERRQELVKLGWIHIDVLVTDEQMHWLKENTQYKYERVGLGLWFENESDAVLFKLRWK